MQVWSLYTYNLFIETDQNPISIASVLRLLSAGLSLSTSEKLFRVTELSPLLYSLFTLSIGGSLAFGLGFSEFLLVSRTSSLTLSISGIFKVLFEFNLCGVFTFDVNVWVYKVNMLISKKT